MNVNTKVTLYTIIPLGYDPIDCTAIDYSVSENALTIECAEVDRLITRAEAAEAEVERLRQELATVAADVKLMLRTPHNHDWLASGDCPRCAIEQRLIANTTPARQRSSGGAVDDD